MDTVATDNSGLWGAIIISLLVYIGYKVATKKSSWDLSGLGKIGAPVPKDWKEKYGKQLLVVVIGGVLLFWSSIHDTQIRPVDMGNLSQKYWLQILIVYGIGAGLIWLNADEKSAKILQKVLAGGVITLLVVLPFYAWITSPSNTTAAVVKQYEGLQIPTAGTDQNLWPESSWLEVELGKGEASPFFRLHGTPERPEGLVMYGKDFRVYCVYRDEHGKRYEISYLMNEPPCPNGDLEGNYAINLFEGENKGRNTLRVARLPS
jgi:hypothetical protein